MFARLSRTAAAFVAVLAMYLAYAMVAVPWIEPTTPRSSGSSASLLPAEGETHHAARRRILESLFPADAWELTDTRVMVLETDYGMLLMSNYRTQDAGQLSIHPCTIVLEIPSSNARPPRYVALQAPEGAVLQFDQSIDLRRAEFSQPVGGRLLGQVRIFSPPTQPGGEDQMEIVTQNVQMDARRVWTPHEVQFRLGRSYGEGRGLTINLLASSSLKSRVGGTPAVAGVQSLELAHLEKVHLEAPPQGLFNDAPSDQASRETPSSPKADALKQPLEITCLGPFRFDFEEYVASFEDDVDVRRLHSDGPSDQLNCRVLEIYFTAPKTALLPRHERNTEGRRFGTDAAERPGKEAFVRRIVAVGQPVFVRAPSIGAFVQGDRLEYDVATRRLRLENRRPAAPDGKQDTDSKAVLEHQGRYFAAPRLQYELGPPHRLGKLSAAGPGVFRGVLPKNLKQIEELGEDAGFEVQWRGEIHLRPHEGLHVASVTGGVAAQVGDVGGFEAGELHLWLQEVPEQSQDTDETQIGRKRDIRYRVLPDRLMAQNGVSFRSPRFSGGARKLEVWFEDAPLAPEQAPAALGSPDEKPEQERRQAFDLRGELVQLRLLRRGKKTTLEDVTVRGNVLLRETQTEKPDDAPLMVAGDLVEVRGASGPHARMVVLGDPQRDLRAQAAARGVAFSGWTLHVDQNIGRVWVDGPGRLTLPLQQHSRARLPGLPVKAKRGPESVTVYWRNRLDFDGRRVLLEDSVETRGDGQVIRSDSLQAFLARPLDFTRPEQFKDTEVSRLLFGGRPEDVNGVVLENQTVEEGEVVSRDQGRTRNIDIDVIAGRMYAAGPGWIESVRRGGFKMVGPTAAATAPPTKPRGLTFVRVAFQEAITGQSLSQDLSHWKMTFHEDVETIVGPVERWEQRLHADSPSGLGARGMLLTSRELSITQMGRDPQGDAQMELAAIGRPHLESLNFNADGDRLSYDGAKGLLVLEGGREDARFWHRTDTGIETDGAAQRIQYWPNENRLDADLRFIDLTGFRNALTPRRKPR